MIIGFRNRSQMVLERDTTINVDVHSARSSELNYEVQFRHVESDSTANVENILFPPHGRFDALFGSQSDPLEDSLILRTGNVDLTLQTRILNDFVPEGLECYTLQILSPDVDQERDNFVCNNEDDSTDYFCLHTICIIDDDG